MVFRGIFSVSFLLWFSFCLHYLDDCNCCTRFGFYVSLFCNSKCYSRPWIKILGSDRVDPIHVLKGSDDPRLKGKTWNSGSDHPILIHNLIHPIPIWTGSFNPPIQPAQGSIHCWSQSYPGFGIGVGQSKGWIGQFFEPCSHLSIHFWLVHVHWTVSTLDLMPPRYTSKVRVLNAQA